MITPPPGLSWTTDRERIRMLRSLPAGGDWRTNLSHERCHRGRAGKILSIIERMSTSLDYRDAPENPASILLTDSQSSRRFSGRNRSQILAAIKVAKRHATVSLRRSADDGGRTLGSRLTFIFAAREVDSTRPASTRFCLNIRHVLALVRSYTQFSVCLNKFDRGSS